MEVMGPINRLPARIKLYHRHHNLGTQSRGYGVLLAVRHDLKGRKRSG
jgi:hypothetical protein